MRRRLTAAAGVLGAVVILASSAGANHAAPARVSAGAVNGNGAFSSLHDGNSIDGTRVWFHSDEQLAATDTDTLGDVYERSGGVTTQISIGPNGDDGEYASGWRGASEDGGRVFFHTNEPLVASDTDADCSIGDVSTGSCYDVYENAGGVVSLVSAGGNGSFHASFRGTSADGARVFFRTQEQLSGSDTDSEGDTYQRSGGTTTLLTTGPSGGNGPVEARFRGSSSDGTRVFFDTAESLVAADTDSAADTYERSGATTTLLSNGPAGGNADSDASFRGASKDGSRVFIETAESLVAGDTDAAVDVYQRSGDASTLISTGSGSGDSLYEGASDGGARVFFTTTDALSAADTDSRRDVYERSDGASTLLSTGPAGGNGPAEAVFQGASADGSTVVIGTTESLIAADTDGRFDLFTRTGGTTSLVSIGSGSFNGDHDASYRDLSGDGNRVVFETIEQLEASDTDMFPDVYERHAGATTRLSTGSSGGNAGQVAVFEGVSDDGTRVFFQTGEPLESSDTDTQSDVYQAAISFGYARPKGATPMLIPLVPSYQACTGPNRMHAPTLSHGSCNPPVQETTLLQVGTFDSNTLPAKSVSTLKLAGILGNPGTPADEADVALIADINDVYRKVPSPPDPPEYTGELGVRLQLQLTDKVNGSVPQDPATVGAFLAGFTVPCVATPDITIGASCALSTTADALVPGMVKEGARTIWEVGQVHVTDGGADGQALTEPNAPFMRQGVFVP